MSKENTNSKSEKWSKDQIELLIDATKDEPCLYASDSPNYHNKHLRKEALEKVYQKVVRLRPKTTVQECQTKFKNLRNQFNQENAKQKASLKSGTGTDDVYKPNLWYYSLLLFLETYVTPRKSRNSLEQIQHPVSQSSGTLMYVSESQIVTNENPGSSEQQQFQICSDGANITLIPVLPTHVTVSATNDEEERSSSVERNSASPATSSTFDTQQTHPLYISTPISSVTATSSDSDTQQNNPIFIAPGRISPALSTSSYSDAQQNISTFMSPGPISPALSSSSTSGVSSGTQRKSKKRSRQDSTDEDFSGAINNLAESLRQPIVVNNTRNTQLSSGDTSVNDLMTFVGSILQTFQDEELKVDFMNTISQTA